MILAAEESNGTKTNVVREEVVFSPLYSDPSLMHCHASTIAFLIVLVEHLRVLKSFAIYVAISEFLPAGGASMV